MGTRDLERKRSSGKNVTLSEVAKAAGVAPMTVSRYLNKHPNISEKTARKVSAAVKRLQYKPNLAARILMGQPSNTVGLILPTLADSFFAEIAHNVQAVARQRGNLVWVASSDGDPEVEASLLHQMQQHHVDGLLLIPVQSGSEEQLDSSGLPVVVIDRPLLGADAVVVDNRGGTSKLVDHLVEHGYKRIVCLSVDPPSIYTIRERIAGYEDVMRRTRLKPVVCSDLRSREDFLDRIRGLLTSSSAPEAIFCTNNITTIQLLEALYEMNVDFPGKIAIAGFDDFELAALIRPGITVVRQPAAELGRQGARTLFERMASNEVGVRGLTTTLPTSLIIRGSCGCHQHE